MLISGGVQVIYIQHIYIYILYIIPLSKWLIQGYIAIFHPKYQWDIPPAEGSILLRMLWGAPESKIKPARMPKSGSIYGIYIYIFVFSCIFRTFFLT